MTGAGPAEASPPGGGLPDAIAAAWGVRERPHKGPKPALSLPRIVEAAVRVADADGLDAVSMGRVASELGAAPMSLYRHVSGKEELLDLIEYIETNPVKAGLVGEKEQWRWSSAGRGSGT